jgi:hypothetical protein
MVILFPQILSFILFEELLVKHSLIAGPDEGPPTKKTKSPPSISPSGSSASLYSGDSGDYGMLFDDFKKVCYQQLNYYSLQRWRYNT